MADLSECLHTLLVVATGDLRDDVIDCGCGGGHSGRREDDGRRRVLDESREEGERSGGRERGNKHGRKEYGVIKVGGTEKGEVKREKGGMKMEEG